MANTWTLICSTFKDQYGNNVSSTFSSEGSGDMAIDGLGNLWIVSSNGSQYGIYELPAPLPTTAVSSITLTQKLAPTTSTPGAGFVGIAFDPVGNMLMATSADLYIMTNNFTLSHIGTFNIAGVCGDLTSCNYPMGILPVHWVDFTASAQSKTVSLNWTVSMSSNSKGFYVERSIDNTNWEVLGFVADNSDNYSAQISYSFSDPNPAPGNNYYRIHQVDYDDASNYSVIKSVNIGSAEAVSVWPNPARSSVYIQNNSSENDLKMQIIDPFGKLITANTLHGGKNEINISNLPAGTYIIHTQNSSGEVQNEKIVKL
ncbi:MAG: T9SS type A sorting domain-containing protein [Bacteroidota bacterium]